jgi:hypothetical protein
MCPALCAPDPPSGLFRKAEVGFEDCGVRGEVEACRISMGDAIPPNSGKEDSSKSCCRRVVRQLVGLPTSMGFLNQGKRDSLSLSFPFALAESKSTGVTGVESREEWSCVVGE